MSNATAVQSLTFTPAERAILAGFAAAGYALDTCAEDGHEWAALASAVVEHDRFSFDDPAALALLSIQLTVEPGRRCVALGPDGRRVLAAGEDLADVLRQAVA